jgi:orotate phosphoribosyltransferase
MELIAKSIEAGEVIGDAIKKALKYVKSNYKGKFDENAFANEIKNTFNKTIQELTPKASKFIENTNTLTTVDKLIKNVHYKKAKSGDVISAEKLINEVIQDRHIQKIKEVLDKNPNAIIAPVFGMDMAGINTIPLTLANKFNLIGKNIVDDKIFIENRPKRTNLNRIERLFSYPEFGGEVVKGADYIIVDDVTTMGTSLKALKDYIENNGGNVVDAFVLGAGRLGNIFEASEQIKKRLIDKFGEKELNLFLNETGRKNVDSLTAKEAKLLESYATINAIRTAAFKSKS